MKTPEEIKAYISKQDWYKELGIDLFDLHSFQLLLYSLLLTAYFSGSKHDWDKISSDFKNWLNNESE